METLFIAIGLVIIFSLVVCGLIALTVNVFEKLIMACFDDKDED